MPGVNTTTLLHISVFLLLLECWPRALAGELRCYSCKTMQSLPHSMHCTKIGNLTYIQECPSTAKYCKKRVAVQENNAVIERTCEEKCFEQTNIKMMSGVTINTYCCETELCNSAISWKSLQTISLNIVVAAMYWL